MHAFVLESQSDRCSVVLFFLGSAFPSNLVGVSCP